MAAVFLPQRDDDESPAIELAGALVIAHVTDGELRVNLSLDTPDPALYRLRSDGQVPVQISVGGDIVYEAPAPSRGTRDEHCTTVFNLTESERGTLIDVLEVALSDPDFIDTTSSGGMSEAEAAAYRDEICGIQARLQRGDRKRPIAAALGPVRRGWHRDPNR